MKVEGSARPRLTTRALRRWLPPLARHLPDLASAYVVPGRVRPSVREATMLGVTSVNRCGACQAVHGRWSRHAGLRLDDMSPAEALAFAYGQQVAVSGPDTQPPPALSRRHRRELAASAVLMELANLAGNRFLPGGTEGGPSRSVTHAPPVFSTSGCGSPTGPGFTVRGRVSRAAPWGDVLELGVGTGSNLRSYPADVSIHGIDVSAPALAIAAARARGIDRRVVLTVADAAALPFPHASFDTIVATFVLCSVGDVDGALREARRVLRPGGTIRLLEHAEAAHPVIAGLQRRSARPGRGPAAAVASTTTSLRPCVMPD